MSIKKEEIEGKENDENYLLQCLEKDGMCLKYASKDIQNNKDIVIVAVKQNGLSLQYASKRLRGFKSISLTSIAENPKSIKFVEEKLINDKEFISKALHTNVNCFQYLPEEQRKDKSIVKEATSIDPNIVAFCGKNIRDTKAIMLNCVKSNGNLYNFASDKLKKDKDIGMEALHTISEKKAMIELMKHFSFDREFMKFCLKKDGMLIKYASMDIQKEYEFIKIALNQNPNSIEFIDSDLVKYDILKKIVGEFPSLLRFIKNQDISFAKVALDKDPMTLVYVSERFRYDFSLRKRYISMIEKNPFCLEYIPDQTTDLVNKALSLNPLSFKCVQKKDDVNDELTILCIQSNHSFLFSLSEMRLKEIREKMIFYYFKKLFIMDKTLNGNSL